MTWAIPPTDGIANDEDIAYLRNWLDGFQDQTSDPLSELDQSELQSKKTNSVLMQRTIDPYGNLWGESYSVESVQSATHVTSESLSGNLIWKGKGSNSGKVRSFILIILTIRIVRITCKAFQKALTGVNK
jgi:hypothetical protein